MSLGCLDFLGLWLDGGRAELRTTSHRLVCLRPSLPRQVSLGGHGASVWLVLRVLLLRARLVGARGRESSELPPPVALLWGGGQLLPDVYPSRVVLSGPVLCAREAVCLGCLGISGLWLDVGRADLLSTSLRLLSPAVSSSPGESGDSGHPLPAPHPGSARSCTGGPGSGPRVIWIAYSIMPFLPGVSAEVLWPSPARFLFRPGWGMMWLFYPQFPVCWCAPRSPACRLVLRDCGALARSSLWLPAGPFAPGESVGSLGPGPVRFPFQLGFGLVRDRVGVPTGPPPSDEAS